MQFLLWASYRKKLSQMALVQKSIVDVFSGLNTMLDFSKVPASSDKKMFGLANKWTNYNLLFMMNERRFLLGSSLL